MTTDREVLAELVAACDGFWSDDGNKLQYIKALAAARARLALPEAVRRHCIACDTPGACRDTDYVHCQQTPSKDDLTEARGNERKELAAKVKRLSGEYGDALVNAARDRGSVVDAAEIGSELDAAIDALAAPQINAPALSEGYKLLRDTAQDERSWHEDAGHENGNYSNVCCHCLREFKGHKRRVICRACANKDQINAPAGTPALPREYSDAWLIERGREAQRVLDSLPDAIRQNLKMASAALPSELSVLQSTVIPIEVQL